MNLPEGQNVLDRIREILTKRKSNFVFESCQSRKFCPESVPTHRMGVTMRSIRGQSSCGPGSYNVDIEDNLRTKPTSNKGYTLGARTTSNKPPLSQSKTPGPGTYEATLSALQPKSFSWRREVEACRKNRWSTPGVGTYELSVPGCRRIPWQRDTMLKPTDLPQVQQQSTIPINTNKVSSFM
ncbi:unnamed protein product [Dicrocoelium dendriticum]|nr:unnamed protein product [Dicrocoelium dendriticum]